MLHRVPVSTPAVAKANAAPPIVVASALTITSNPYGELFDPGFTQRSAPVLVPQPVSLEVKPAPVAAAPAFETASLENVPLPPKRELFEPVESVPLPPPRPAELESPESAPAPVRHSAQPSPKTALPADPTDSRTFIQKLFGLVPHPGPALGYAAPESNAVGRGPAAGATALGYATPETSAVGKSSAVSSSPSASRGGSSRSLFGFLGSSSVSPTSLGYDQYTAVYDLTAHVVYLPDGTKLEAHSGLGDRLDDPNHVNEIGRGATPPHVYELTPREEIFHGVQALRLTPVGGGDIFGRAGLLAHSYMLGPNGDSNGCVSFKDYDAFLRAYQNGQIKKLAVVARL